MRILVVEDEPGISGFLKQGLEEESFSVDVAEDGRKGLDLALAGEYDLLLLDWMVPGLSGIEVCRQIRQKDQETPIIFLTAKDTVDETVFGLEVGANDYIKKPFNFDELLARIQVQLRSSKQNSKQLHLGEIIVDPASHEVTVNGKPVALTKKEFALLQFLIQNKNKVCTRTRIIESVWDIHFQYNTGVIDVFINVIRKKLGIDQKDGPIQTVRGVGYIAKDQ